MRNDCIGWSFPDGRNGKAVGTPYLKGCRKMDRTKFNCLLGCTGRAMKKDREFFARHF